MLSHQSNLEFIVLCQKSNKYQYFQIQSMTILFQNIQMQIKTFVGECFIWKMIISNPEIWSHFYFVLYRDTSKFRNLVKEWNKNGYVFLPTFPYRHPIILDTIKCLCGRAKWMPQLEPEIFNGKITAHCQKGKKSIIID